MTSEFSAASLRSQSGSAAREGLAPMPLLLIGVVFAIAIGLRQVVPLNTDVSWLLVIGERMLDGQRLYRDIIEINPDRKSTRLNSSHTVISYAVFCLKKKKNTITAM